MAGKRGAPQKIDISFMAVCALLLHNLYGIDKTPAARAAMRAYHSVAQEADRTPPLKRFMEAHQGAVLKALQRLRTGKAPLHPDILRAAGTVQRSTGKPAFGTAPELARWVLGYLEE